MKKAILLALALSVLAAPVWAENLMGRKALGFTTTAAPIGGRLWFSDQVGIDAGVGFKAGDLTDFAFTAGVPINMFKGGDRVRFNLRPSLEFVSTDQGADSDVTFRIGAELEFEVFLTNDFSVRAAHGVAFESFDPAGPDDSSTQFVTTGTDLTSAGFFFYF